MSASRAALFTGGTRHETTGPVTRTVRGLRDAAASAAKEREEEFLSGIKPDLGGSLHLREDLLRAAASSDRAPATAPRSRRSAAAEAGHDDMLLGSIMSMGRSMESNPDGWGSMVSGEASLPYPSDATVTAATRTGSRHGARREAASAMALPSRAVLSASGKQSPGRGYTISGGVATPMAADATVASLISPFTSTRSHKLAFRGSTGSSTPYARRSRGDAGSVPGSGPPILPRSPYGLPGTSVASLGELVLPRDASAVRIASSGQSFVQVPTSTLAALGRGAAGRRRAGPSGSGLDPVGGSWRGADGGQGAAPRRQGDGAGGGVPVPPLVHTSAEHLASMAPEERKVVLLQDWDQAYDEGGPRDPTPGGRVFRSALLHAELKLSRARIFSSSAAAPSDVTTAVAFEVLERLEAAVGPLAGLLRVVRRVLAQAAYVEPAASEEEAEALVPGSSSVAAAGRAAAAEAGAGRRGASSDGKRPSSSASARAARVSAESASETTSMRKYYALTLHASDTVRMREERERVRGVAERLRSTLVGWERARQDQQERAQRKHEVVSTWQRLLARTSKAQTVEARAELAATLDGEGGGEGGGGGGGGGPSGGPGGKQRDGAPPGYGTVDGAVDALLAVETDADRLKALLQAMESMPHLIRDAVRALLVGSEGVPAAVGVAPAAQLALEALTARPGGTPTSVLVGAVRGLFRSPAVADDAARRAALMAEVLSALGAGALDSLPAVLRVVMQAHGGAWRGPAVRLLSSVDDELLQPSVVDAHVAGEEVDAVRVVRPGELGKQMTSFFSRDEQLSLLRDLLDALGGEAMGSCTGAMLDARGPLHAPIREELPSEDRVGMLRLLMQSATADEVRSAMPDGMLRALSSAGGGPGDDGSGVAGAAASASSGAASGDGGGPPAKAIPAAAQSMLKYTRRPPRSMRGKGKLKAERAASLVYEVWAAKAREDTFDDSRGEERQALGAYTRDYLLQKLGLASLADGALYGLVDALRRPGPKNQRLSMFGTMLGVLEPEAYSPRRADVFLHLCKLCFPKFTDKTLKNRPPGTCFVPADRAAAAISRGVFSPADDRLPASTQRMGLEADLRAALLDEVAARTQVYGDAIAPFLGDSEAAAASSGSAGRPRGGSGPPQRNLRGQPDFVLTLPVVDFDWLSGRVLEVWGEQRARDAASLEWLFQRHDTDGNGVLSFGEFQAMLADCLPLPRTASGQSKRRSGAQADGGGDPAAVEPRPTLPPPEARPPPPLLSRRTEAAGASSRSVRSDASGDGGAGAQGPGGMSMRQTVRLFEEVLALTRAANHGADDDDVDSASPASFSALCDAHGVMPPPYAREAARAAAGASAAAAALAPRPTFARAGSLRAPPTGLSGTSSVVSVGSRRAVSHRRLPRLPSSRLLRVGSGNVSVHSGDSGTVERPAHDGGSVGRPALSSARRSVSSSVRGHDDDDDDDGNDAAGFDITAS